MKIPKEFAELILMKSRLVKIDLFFMPEKADPQGANRMLARPDKKRALLGPLTWWNNVSAQRANARDC
jgi:hypothetical protein